MNKAKGFTLIELVVVVAVLGILAATALPKYLELTKEAKVSTLKATKGAVLGADNMVYGKAVLSGQHKLKNADINVGKEAGENNNEDVKVAANYGHIKNTEQELNKVLTLSDVYILDLIETTFNEEKKFSTVITFDPALTDRDDLDTMPKCYIKVTQKDTSGKFAFENQFDDC